MHLFAQHPGGRLQGRSLLCRDGAGGWTGRIIGMIIEGEHAAVYTWNTRAYRTPLETAYVLCHKLGVPRCKHKGNLCRCVAFHTEVQCCATMTG